MRIYIGMIAIFLAGCSDKDTIIEAVKALEKSCDGKLSAELHIGNWDKSMTFKCDDWGKEEPDNE